MAAWKHERKLVKRKKEWNQIWRARASLKTVGIAWRNAEEAQKDEEYQATLYQAKKENIWRAWREENSKRNQCITLNSKQKSARRKEHSLSCKKARRRRRNIEEGCNRKPTTITIMKENEKEAYERNIKWKKSDSSPKKKYSRRKL